jgi:hypothetical protein
MLFKSSSKMYPIIISLLCQLTLSMCGNYLSCALSCEGRDCPHGAAGGGGAGNTEEALGDRKGDFFSLIPTDVWGPMTVSGRCNGSG